MEERRRNYGLNRKEGAIEDGVAVGGGERGPVPVHMCLGPRNMGIRPWYFLGE